MLSCIISKEPQGIVENDMWANNINVHQKKWCYSLTHRFTNFVVAPIMSRRLYILSSWNIKKVKFVFVIISRRLIFLKKYHYHKNLGWDITFRTIRKGKFHRHLNFFFNATNLYLVPEISQTSPPLTWFYRVGGLVTPLLLIL